jgi:quercetin dioxygenase-like cupin family protein
MLKLLDERIAVVLIRKNGRGQKRDSCRDRQKYRHSQWNYLLRKSDLLLRSPPAELFARCIRPVNSRDSPERGVSHFRARSRVLAQENDMLATTALAPVVSRRRLANTVTFGTVNVSLLLTAAETGGSLSLMETSVRPGTEPPYHIHDNEDEIFYVLEGHLSVMVDGTVHECRAGDTIFLPRRIPHTFRVRSEVAHCLSIVTPSGFENFFKAIGKPAGSLAPPAAENVLPNFPEIAARASAAYGVRLASSQPEF